MLIVYELNFHFLYNQNVTPAGTSYGYIKMKYQNARKH